MPDSLHDRPDTTLPDAPKPSTRPRFAAAIAVAHAFAAGAWAVAMAGGFDASHPMSIANRWIPLAVGLVSLATCTLAIRRRRVAATVGATLLLGLWAGSGIGARAWFPVSAGAWWWWVALVGLLMPWALGRNRLGLRIVALGLGGAIGATAMWTQRAPDPTTIPSGGEIPRRPTTLSPCGRGTTATFDLGPVRVETNPLLVFESVSPDRFWTALAPGSSWRGEPMRCIGAQESGTTHRLWFEAAGGDPHAFVSAGTQRDGRGLFLEAITHLDQPVFSHLNHAFEATLHGREPIQLRFGPCAGDGFAPPSPGQPSVFAFVDADRQLVVAQASRQEKGPFTQLCRAALPAHGRLRIEVATTGGQVGEIELVDYADQADTSASPTAGWGVPGNAIEMWSYEEGRLVFLTATFAGTSVGRGWHSIGHSAGSYRSRIVLRSGSS